MLFFLQYNFTFCDKIKKTAVLQREAAVFLFY